MPAIQISDVGPNGALRFDLEDVLGHLPSEVHQWHWSLLDLEVVKAKPGATRASVARTRLEHEDHFPVSWPDLVALSSEIAQTLTCLLVASKEADSTRSLRVDANLVSVCDLVIECVDSSFWLVHARETRLLDDLKKAFKSIRDITPEDFGKRTLP